LERDARIHPDRLSNNSFFLKKASLIAYSERDKWCREIWKSDPYLICGMNRGMQEETKQQEKDVSRTTAHNQLLHLSIPFGT
jgi:hypothetical protein